jgi:tungstate transport system substrate-binding protein
VYTAALASSCQAGFVRPRIIARILFALIAAVSVSRCHAAIPPALTLATTTSVGNSGLLDPLEKASGDEHGIELRSHLVGSGLAIEMLARGDVDVVISHAPALEAAALREHPGWSYRKIMFNDFVLVGPSDDPARIQTATGIEEAIKRIASSSARFLSRGDRSGTHEREEALWTLAGTRPVPDRLVVAGAGMGATLRIASETGSYTLTDRATFAQLAPNLRLKILFEGGVNLLNTYAVIVDPAGARARDAADFADWLSEGKGREVIQRYQVGGNVQAFNVWPLGRPRKHPGDLPY